MREIKIISWNVNGIRAVEKKQELQKLIDEQKPDVLFLQEIKAMHEQLSAYLTQNNDYHQFYHSAQKKGYAGVGLWVKKSLAKKEPKVITGIPDFDDTEGRVIRVDLGKYSLLGIYFPNGGKSPQAWQGKLKFYDLFHHYVNQLRNDKRKVIWCGDLNVAHCEIDLTRAKENKKSIGFLPEERAWVDRLIEDNWIDTFRDKYPKKASYTWWNMVTKARERNVGWRIDYFILDKKQKKDIIEISHLNNQFGSDHCPVELQLNVTL